MGFKGADLCPEARPAQRFGGSVPLDKACRREVLLAWAMNGEPLPPVHGAPLRVVVPATSARAASSGSSGSRSARRPGRGTSSTSSTGCCPRTGRRPGRGHATRPRRAQRRRAVARPTARRSRPARSRCAATRSRAGSGTSRASTSRSTAARAGPGRAARGPRPLGVAALADHRRPRARRARDRRPRLGLLGGHAAGGRGRAVEPEGLRQQRPPAGPRARRLAPRGPAELNERTRIAAAPGVRDALSVPEARLLTDSSRTRVTTWPVADRRERRCDAGCTCRHGAARQGPARGGWQAFRTRAITADPFGQPHSPPWVSAAAVVSKVPTFWPCGCSNAGVPE